MSPAAKRPPKPKPVRPWQRAEAGRYRSSDERFRLESGGGTWFVTDGEVLDEMGLARTMGPFATLDAAKAAADAARDRPADESPLAARIAEAAASPRKADSAATPRSSSRRGPAHPRAQVAEPSVSLVPVPPPRTWLDDLEDVDRDAATRARRLVSALEREGVADADALVRRDLLGSTPAVATRLLARDVLAAMAALPNPSPTDVAEAVASVLASSQKRAGLPGWQLVERDGPNGERRGLRLTTDDLRAAAGDNTEK